MTVLLKVLYNGPIMKTVSITDLKQNTTTIINKIKAGGKPVIVMQRSKPAAILVDPMYWESIEQALEDAEDIQSIKDRKDEPTVSLDEYFIKRFKRSLK